MCGKFPIHLWEGEDWLICFFVVIYYIFVELNLLHLWVVLHLWYTFYTIKGLDKRGLIYFYDILDKNDQVVEKDYIYDL